MVELRRGGVGCHALNLYPCDIWRNGNSDFSRISCILENPAKSLLNARCSLKRNTGGGWRSTCFGGRLGAAEYFNRPRYCLAGAATKSRPDAARASAPGCGPRRCGYGLDRAPRRPNRLTPRASSARWWSRCRPTARPANGMRLGAHHLLDDESSSASREKVVRFKQPHQLFGPLAGLRHLSGISEREGFRQGLVEQ